MTKYRVIVSKNTFRMLDKHIIFLAKVSLKNAHFLHQTFVSKVKSLDNNPERYPLWLPPFKLPKAYRKIVIKKHYLVLFYVENNTVFVDYILDCRMDNSNIELI